MEGKEGRDEDIRIRGEKCIKKISLAHIMLILPLRRVARKATKRNIFVLVVFLKINLCETSSRLRDAIQRGTKDAALLLLISMHMCKERTL